jgi:hypothetical protein
MRRHHSLLLAAVFAATQIGAETPPPVGLEVIRAFRRLAALELWPDFKPGETPVEFFDGATTYLFNFPALPEGFHPVAGQANVYAYTGRHPTVVANTGTLVNGIPTATADVSRSAEAPDVLAALLLHETFHVFEAKHYPHWSGNEVALFTYPASDVVLLTLRRLESIALCRALEARRPEDATCWAARALAIRAKRFDGLPQAAVAYERSEELYEGLAQYVQNKSIGKPAALSARDFPAGQAQVRQRAYASGEALGLLLDGLDPTWKSRLGGDPPSSLDSLLTSRLQEMAVRTDCDFTAEEREAARARSERDVADFVAGLHRQHRDFLAAKGVRLEVIAGTEPLWPQAFDPWNVLVLDDKAVLHTRLLKLGNQQGAIEVLGRSALTEAAGEHPLFNGVGRMVVTGLVAPKVSVAQGKVTLEAEGLKGTFSGSVERKPDVVRIRLP